jgi:hypothetical protein
MALNESNANKYNIRRAEAFAAAGIRDADIAYAHPRFMGKGHGNCTLCGKKGIMWLYKIHFDAPTIVDSIAGVAAEITRTEAVDFDPVGSECIQTWADPLPESKEKIAFLKRWKAELDACNRAKAVQATDNLLQKLGFGGTEGMIARVAAVTQAQINGIRWSDRRAIANLGRKLKTTKKLTSAAAKFLADAILRAEAVKPVAPAPVAAAPTPPPPPAAPAQPVATDPVLEAAVALMADAALFETLKPYDRSVVKDITAKVQAKGGKFASDRQRKYLADLIGRAKKVGQVVEETVEETPAVDPTVPFVSPSGIAGARY